MCVCVQHSCNAPFISSVLVLALTSCCCCCLECALIFNTRNKQQAASSKKQQRQQRQPQPLPQHKLRQFRALLLLSDGFKSAFARIEPAPPGLGARPCRQSGLRSAPCVNKWLAAAVAVAVGSAVSCIGCGSCTRLPACLPHNDFQMGAAQRFMCVKQTAREREREEAGGIDEGGTGEELGRPGGRFLGIPRALLCTIFVFCFLFSVFCLLLFAFEFFSNREAQTVAGQMLHEPVPQATCRNSNSHTAPAACS